jgi:Ger(x)C family germination protein
MRYRLILLILTVGLFLFMTGCGKGKETDQVAYITALGIDKAGQDKIKITYQILIPRAAGGIQGVGQQIPGGPSVISSIIAVNATEAHNLLNTTISRYSNQSHIKSIIVSEELARNGVGDVLGSLFRWREYSSRIFFAVVRGQAEDFIKMNNPKLDYLPVKWFEAIELKLGESGYSAATDLHDFYLRLKNPGGSSYASYIGLNPLTGEDKPISEKIPNDKMDAYLAGDIPRTGTAGPAEFAGIAVFAGDKMVGVLDTRETNILRMLQDNFPQGRLVLDDQLQPNKAINLIIRNGNKPKISVDLVDGQEVIKISVFLEGEITSIQSGINYEKDEYLELLEAEVANVITQEIQEFIRHTQQLGCDVFGFGYYLRPKFSTYDELVKTNLEDLYKTASVGVKVTVKIRRAGLMWRTSPFKSAATSQ